MPPSWKMLTDAIRFYLEANPAMHGELVTFIHNQGNASGVSLPEGATVMTDALDWYEQVRDLGQGRHVSVYDLPELLTFGFGIYVPEQKRTIHLFVNLNSFQRTFPTHLRKMLRNEHMRRELAQLISQGNAPDLKG